MLAMNTVLKAAPRVTVFVAIVYSLSYLYPPVCDEFTDVEKVNLTETQTTLSMSESPRFKYAAQILQ